MKNTKPTDSALRTQAGLDRIAKLRIEAGEHGDQAMVAICDRALDGTATLEDIARTAGAIAAANAMEDR